jgi:hypothetical protein
MPLLGGLQHKISETPCRMQNSGSLLRQKQTPGKPPLYKKKFTFLVAQYATQLFALLKKSIYI